MGDYGNGSVLRYNGTTGAFIDQFVTPGSGGLVGPTFLVFDANTDHVSVPDTSSALSLFVISLAVLCLAKMRARGLAMLT